MQNGKRSLYEQDAVGCKEILCPPRKLIFRQDVLLFFPKIYVITEECYRRQNSGTIVMFNFLLVHFKDYNSTKFQPNCMTFRDLRGEGT